uniref:Uncharacterized protein n=1 Tax=Nelumbo nucifera TaxID=4432 RepID=A0A822Z9F8_NELNU|nr:TPA_asm: hypothetical protein HUJ06_015543 [Nelumbo nucifera]
MELACKLLGVLSEVMGLETDALTKACVDMHVPKGGRQLLSQMPAT